MLNSTMAIRLDRSARNEPSRIKLAGSQEFEKAKLAMGRQIPDGVYADSERCVIRRVADIIENASVPDFGELTPAEKLVHDINAIRSLLLPSNDRDADSIPNDINAGGRLATVAIASKQFLETRRVLTPAHLLDSMITFNHDKRIRVVGTPEYRDHFGLIMIGILRELEHDVRAAVKFGLVETLDGEPGLIRDQTVCACAVMDSERGMIVGGFGKKDTDYTNVRIIADQDAVGLVALLTTANAIMKCVADIMKNGKILEGHAKEVIVHMGVEGKEMPGDGHFAADFLGRYFERLVIGCSRRETDIRIATFGMFSGYIANSFERMKKLRELEMLRRPVGEAELS